MITPTVLITLQLFVPGLLIDEPVHIVPLAPTQMAKVIADLYVAPPVKDEPSQQASAEEDLQSSVMRIYTLQHATAGSMVAALDKLLPLFHATRFYSDQRTNSIILVGSEKSLKKIIEMMKAVDAPPKKEVMDEEMVRIPIKYRDAKDVENKLYALSPTLRISVDQKRSTIFLRGPKPEIAKIRKIIEKLDTPTARVRLEFAFFKALPDVDPSAQPIPKDLVDVADELKRFGHITLIGRLSTIAVEGQKFSVSGQISDQLYARVKGWLLSASSKDAVKIQLESEMILFKPAAASTEKKVNNRQSRSNFELETVVTTQTGDYVVLGSAPSGWSAGESAILLLHVRP